MVHTLVAKQNIGHSFATNPNRGSSAGAESKPVKGRKIGEAEWNKYKSTNEAARQLNFNSGGICRACKKGHQHKGYLFEYAEPNEPPLLEGEEWKKCKNGGGAEVSNKGRFYHGRIRMESSRHLDHSLLDIVEWGLKGQINTFMFL